MLTRMSLESERIVTSFKSDLFAAGLRYGSMRCQVERERQELVGQRVRRGVRPSQLRRRLHRQVPARSFTG